MSASESFAGYIGEIDRAVGRGDATEHTHRPAMKNLLEALGDNIAATNEPRRIACGAPDFVVTRRQRTVGYIEAKDIGENLNAIERDSQRTEPRTVNGKQFKRYHQSLNNLILTDYLDFRWFVDGAARGSAQLGYVGSGGRLVVDESGISAVADLILSFYELRMPSAGTPRELAERMAHITRLIRDLTVSAFELEPEAGSLHGQLSAFRQTLIPDLTIRQFADMYAQTIAYGLFAARTTRGDAELFSRQQAVWSLPRTNPFLRSLFTHIAGPDLDDRIAWLVDDLAQLLGEADMAAVLKDFGRRTRREDPVVHFYETFLKEYDPETREMRGVYYTPEPVVSYIVRSVDCVLQNRFGRRSGLSDTDTLVLDPAAGTGTFLYTAIKLIKERIDAEGRGGAWNDYVVSHLLPRLFGFELLMAPYAIAHLKLGLELHELGYEFGSDERLGVYLTNTLEEAVQASELLFTQFISEEANAAARIKSEEPIMVVTGNPPYSGHSANRGRWISELLRDYYHVDGQPLREKNPKWLQDDYVKFIRFGQWRIGRTGQGILAFVTNHGYLDNPTFRGMRQQLMNNFSEIYVIDLHGNSKRRERAPDGGPDENVFDIQQGVAIGIFVREADKEGPARVWRADIYGLRETKYEWLAREDVESHEWAELEPTTPDYLFAPRDLSLKSEYEGGWSVRDVMPSHVLGFQTHRDGVAIGFDQRQVISQVHAYRGRPLNQDEKDRYVKRIEYRPMDWRYAYFGGDISDRPRLHIMRHLFQDNVAINLVRQTRAESWAHAIVSDAPAPAVFVEIKEGSTVFPLYTYPEVDEPGATRTMEALDASPWPPGVSGRRPNLSEEFVRVVSENTGLGFVTDGRGDLKSTSGPDDIFAYMYAILNASDYKRRYSEALKRGFPFVPLPPDASTFVPLARLGSELVATHLLRFDASEGTPSFPVEGSNEVTEVRYAENDRRVFVNRTQYFEGIEPQVWAFFLGGYQVCEKWLKDRRGRRLSYQDVTHYQKLAAAVHETIRLVGEIDSVVPVFPIE